MPPTRWRTRTKVVPKLLFPDTFWSCARGALAAARPEATRGEKLLL
jgi:hypothetical protein